MKRFKKAMLMPWTNKVNYTQIVQQVAPANLLAYWIMGEASGTTALDSSGNGRMGAYTGVTLGNAGIGDGRTSAGFDGATSFNNIFSASLAAAFNGSEGTVTSWARVSGSAVWTSGVAHRIVVFQVDANNQVQLRRGSTNNTLQWVYNAGGTTESVTLGSLSTLNWMFLAWTWSASADQCKAYYKDDVTPFAQVGVTQTGLGIWAGTPAATTTQIGSLNTTPAQVWNGTLAHAAVWNTPLTSAQIATLAVVP